ncbi:sigma-70 family RNA polymerase sigma factor [Streptomyces coeruleorubidus]|uniref:sigma-70 family RNA polymerase sigma factor n=1 Tax=Streptomyces coeruleorubidus TaxID=116188 RepID=UPI0036FBA707
MRDRTSGAPAPGAVLSDAHLTAFIRSGPPDAADKALDELYRRHRTAVIAYARTCTRDAHTAEDLASEAFARALRAVRGGAGPEGAWRPYLLTTVRRTAASWAATADRIELSPDFGTWLSEAPSGEEQTLLREDADLIQRAFRSLPERWQTALWHSAVEEEPAKRIAPLLGISPSGVASLTARAREGLREAYLTEYAADPTMSDDCRHFTGLLAASVRRGGRHGAHSGLERHLSGCRRCRRANHQLWELNNSLKAVLPAGVLLWVGASYGTKAVGAATVAGSAGSGGTGSAAGTTAATTGATSTVKVAGIGAAFLALSIGGYAALPDGTDPPSPRPTQAATRPSLSPSPTPTPTPSERHDPEPSSPTPSARASKQPTPPAWQPAADDRAQLPIVSTGRCMDISTAEGAEPYEATCDGSRTQQWELLVDRAAQEARIRNYATGMCLTHSGASTDGAPVRQERACNSTAATARWTYFFRAPGTVNFAQKGNTTYFLGIDEWNKADGPHSPAIGTTANYYDTDSLRFRYTGDVFSG